MAYADSFRINIAIEDMNRLTSSILHVSNVFQNKNVTIHERVCASPPPYYLYWFERYYPNVPLNLDDGPFCPQCMNGIRGTKPDGIQWNRLLDSVVTIIKYKKNTIYHAIYIKVLTDGTVSYLTVSTDDVLNTTNNETAFPEPTRVFEEHLVVFTWSSQVGNLIRHQFINLKLSPHHVHGTNTYTLTYIDAQDSKEKLIKGQKPCGGCCYLFRGISILVSELLR